VAIEVITAMELNQGPTYVFGKTEANRSQLVVADLQQDLRQVLEAAGQPDGRLY
jgi:hypothetical protein